MNHKRTVRLIALQLLCIIAVGVVSGCSQSEKVRVVRKGHEVTVAPSGAFVGNVIRLLESCSYNSTAYAVKTNTWQKLLRSDSFVAIRFEKTQLLNVMVQTGTYARSARDLQKMPVDEILVPLPEGDLPHHIYARTGTNVFAVTKYSPVALKKVAFEPVLQLSSVKPYSDFAGLDRWTWARLKSTLRELLHLD